MDRRVAVGAGAALVVVAAVLSSPSWALARAAWLAADPLRLATALLVLAVVRPFLAWPTTLLAVLSGYGYGLVGVPVAIALVTLTSVPPYLFARRLGDSGRVAAAGRRVVDATGGVRGVTASRFAPVPSDVVSVAAGVAGVRLRAFLVGTAVGEVPWMTAGVVFGASADRLLAGAGLGDVFDPWLVAAAGLAGLALLVGPAYRHLVAPHR